MFFITILFINIVTIILIYVICRKKMHYWLLSDIIRSIKMLTNKKPAKGQHIIFAFVDHFEPGNRGANIQKQVSRVDAWVENYPKLANKHRDSDNIPPQHTFFFPPHYDTHNHLERIVGLCSQGYGEVEMHLHHDRQDPWPDTETSLRGKINDCLESFSRYGIFCLPEGTKRFCFIHGDWALANSLRNGAHCGINDEISILREAGCYADFTFPVCNEAQPKFPNQLIWGASSPQIPKGYNKYSEIVQRGKGNTESLMIIQGIIGVRWKSRKHKIKPSIEQSNIDISDIPTPERIDYWIRKNIHIPGKREWIFVKVHTHGAREEDRDVLLGEVAESMYSYLESEYNDKDKYLLHYVTAREMYNIAMAAVNGKRGNPNFYRNYIIPRYTYLPKR